MVSAQEFPANQLTFEHSLASKMGLLFTWL